MSFTVYGEHPEWQPLGIWRLPREPSSRPLISSAMDGRAFTFRMIRAKSFGPIGSISSIP
jgi:hypothetical protein